MVFHLKQKTHHSHHHLNVCPNQHGVKNNPTSQAITTPSTTNNKNHSIPPPQPPTRTSSNPEQTLRVGNNQIERHQEQCSQAQGQNINNSNTSTLKKRVQIQEVTV